MALLVKRIGVAVSQTFEENSSSELAVAEVVVAEGTTEQAAPEQNSDQNLDQNLEQSAEQAPIEESTAKPTALTLAFQEKLAGCPDAEAKLGVAIAFLRETLEQKKTASFKDFWDARTLCLPLFKEKINPIVRAKCWEDFQTLLTEARRLKDMLDEESAFAAKQIELAIGSMEIELAAYSEGTLQFADIVFQAPCKTFTQQYAIYNKLQGELDFLNAYAMRVGALRKELIRTEMRIRFKNKFFARLSKLGDVVFGRRRELINAVSAQFCADCTSFVEENFPTSRPIKGPFFELCDEIKGLQAGAKVLTLNNQAFSMARNQLSVAWDQVRHVERERRKERSQERAERTQHLEALLAKVETLSAQIADATLGAGDALSALKALQLEARNVRLDREHVQIFKAKCQTVAEPLQALAKEEEYRIEEAARLEAQRRHDEIQAKIADFASRIEAASSLDGDEAEKAVQSLRAEFKAASLPREARFDLDRGLKNLAEKIAERKEASLLNLPQDKQESLKALKQVLVQRQARRQEAKERLAAAKKAQAQSGLDFERSLAVQEEVDQAKEAVTSLEAAVYEIQMQIQRVELG